MTETIRDVAQFKTFINQHPLVVVHVMKDHCSVCHAVLPQVKDLLQETFPQVKLAIINQNEVTDIAGELSIFTVPVDLIFMNGKEMHRQGRFIDLQKFERQLTSMYEQIYESSK
ncbi:thioredoxin family protein [Staphylococcus pasteuri]|uniref:thioredoxin family protein n=1 Tax=Staphylococcus pasteuri TaxID=45972 RepID=UPI00326151FC